MLVNLPNYKSSYILHINRLLNLNFEFKDFTFVNKSGKSVKRNVKVGIYNFKPFEQQLYLCLLIDTPTAGNYETFNVELKKAEHIVKNKLSKYGIKLSEGENVFSPTAGRIFKINEQALFCLAIIFKMFTKSNYIMMLENILFNKYFCEDLTIKEYVLKEFTSKKISFIIRPKTSVNKICYKLKEKNLYYTYDKDTDILTFNTYTFLKYLHNYIYNKNTNY